MSDDRAANPSPTEVHADVTKAEFLAWIPANEMRFGADLAQEKLEAQGLKVEYLRPEYMGRDVWRYHFRATS